MHFGENQLSRDSISFSLLPTAHPRSFHPPPVRASSGCYPAFTLAMGSSSRFGSAASDSSPYSDSLSLRLRLNGLASPLTTTPGLIMQKARRHPATHLNPLLYP